MSVKLNSVAKISPVSVKNCNQIDKLSEKMVLSASNCRKLTFDNAAIGAREEKVMVTCASDSHEDKLGVEVSPGSYKHVVPSERSNVERDLEDVTESSSSFGCTDSETENAEMPSDEEVESIFREDNDSLFAFDGFNDFFRTRKQKVSDHWRDFVRPLMWRCRWVELCVKELNSKASKYEKEIAENYERKQNGSAKTATDFICQNQQKVMKRRKRKRVEETTDIASYTSCHNLFSYYANRKPIVGSAYKDSDCRNADAETNPFDDAFGVNDEFPAFDLNKNDAFENILRKIEEAQSQVRQLSARMDKLFIENAEKFTSSFAPCDALASSPIVVGNSLCAISPQNDVKSLCMPESTVYNNGEEIPLPNMTESIGYPGKCENMENNGFLLTHTQPVKQELNEEVIQHPDSPEKTTGLRSRRKPRTGNWNRRSSGSG